MVILRKSETKVNRETLYKLKEQEKYLRNLKSFLEQQLFRLQIEELNIKSAFRNKRIKAEKIKLEEEAKAEYFKKELENETVKMASATETNVKSIPQTSMFSGNFVEYLEPVELTTTGIDDIMIESGDDDTVF